MGSNKQTNKQLYSKNLHRSTTEHQWRLGTGGGGEEASGRRLRENQTRLFDNNLQVSVLFITAASSGRIPAKFTAKEGSHKYLVIFSCRPDVFLKRFSE